MLTGEGVNARLVSSATRLTIRKSRIFAGHHQVARVDHETISGLEPDDENALTEAVSGAGDSDVILVSDYAKGSVNAAVMGQVRAIARARAVPVVVDPKATDWSLYRGVDVLKPNVAELGHASGMPTRTTNEILAAGAHMSAEMNPAAVVVTRGADGISLFVGGEHVMDDAGISREVVDVTGAGDTVAVCISLARATGMEWPAVLRIANLAAGIAIRRAGTTVVSLEELIDEAANA